MELHPLKIRFYPKLKSGSEEQYALYMRMTLTGKRTDIALSYELARSMWNEKEQSLKGGHKDKGFVLNLTNQFRQRAQEIYQQCIQRNMDCDVNVIRKMLTGDKNEATAFERTVLCLFDRVITRKESLAGPNNTKPTIYKYKRCKTHLQKFVIEYYSADDVKFNQVNLQFIEDFELYLKAKGGCCHNTAMKHIRTFKTIFKAAQAHGYTDKDPFQKYRIRMEEVVRYYLNEVEIEKLIELDLPPNKLANVRDLFIFCCYTGLAYIDLKNLSGKHIQRENGKFWIRTRRQKTNVKSNIPLLDQPMKLIKKHCPEFESKDPDERIFRVISNQKMNAYLKELAKECGIKKALTFHLARHTFATTITLNNGVPIESVSSMLGHRNITTTQHYAKLLDRKLEEDMDRLGIILNGK